MRLMQLKYSKLCRAFACAVLSAVLVFSAAIYFQPAHAVPSSSLQTQANALAAKLEGWQMQLNAASDNYYVALDKYTIAFDAAQAVRDKIEYSNQLIASNQSQLSSRATTMYKDGPLSIVDFLLGATSFEELTSTWDVLNSINDDTAKLIDSTRVIKQQAEADYIELEKQETIAREAFEVAEAIKNEAEAITAQMTAELASINDELRAAIEAEQASRAAGSNPGGNWSFSGNSNYYDGSTGGTIVNAAMSRQGAPYVWAAGGPNSFDCSGLVQWAYKQAGIYLPHQSESQYYGAPIRMPVSEAQPGDILWRDGHVGIYIGGGQYVHAPQTGDVVRVASNIGQFWGAARY